MEYTWLAIGILSFGTWLFSSIQEGLGNHYMLLIIALASFAMFFFRKYLRKQYAIPKDRDETEK
jgi:hypothetical protein